MSLLRPTKIIETRAGSGTWRDHEAFLADDVPVPTVPPSSDVFDHWGAELVALLVAHPAQRSDDPNRGGFYFAAQARRRLTRVKHDRQAAGLLMAL